MARRIFLYFVATGLFAQTAFFPLKDIKAGMRGTGKTVFSGDRVEDFEAEILGVLDNIGPKQSLILAKLSGGPSGPNGRDAGDERQPGLHRRQARRRGGHGLPLLRPSPSPASGPSRRCCRWRDAPADRTTRAGVSLADRDLTRVLPKPEQLVAGDARMVDIATPVSFGGFTRATVEQFAPQLRALGLEPRQGISGGRQGGPAHGSTRRP